MDVKHKLLFGILTFFTLHLIAQTTPADLSERQMHQDFDRCISLFRNYHDNLFIYVSEAEYETFIDAQREKIEPGISIYDFYNLIAEVVTFPRCGHTKSRINNSHKKQLYPPFSIYYDGTKVSVIADHTTGTNEDLTVIDDEIEEGIPLGSEILAINGEPIDEILLKMATHISRDGFIQSKIKRNIDRKFWNMYPLMRNYPETYQITFLPPVKEEVVQNLNTEHFVAIEDVARTPVTKEFDAIGSEAHKALQNQEPVETSSGDPKLDLKILDHGKAYMRVGSFNYSNNPRHFTRFVDQSFASLEEHSVTDLILDVRGNGGGDPVVSSYLVSHFAKNPFYYFTRDVSYYYSLRRQQFPHANGFKGNVYLLGDGFIGSTCGHFVSLMKYLDLAKFIGEETGSTYFCSGNATSFTLPNSQTTVRIGRGKYQTRVEGMELGVGILPDFPFLATTEEVLENRDSLLEYAVSIVDEKVITYSVEPTSSGRVSRSGGLSATLTAVAHEGFQFVGWRELPNETSNVLNIIDPVEIPTHYTAVFEELISQ